MTKRILITGGNSGIGKVTATQLSKDGFEIVIAGRPGKKTEEALAGDKRRSPDPQS